MQHAHPFGAGGHRINYRAENPHVSGIVYQARACFSSTHINQKTKLMLIIGRKLVRVGAYPPLHFVGKLRCIFPLAPRRKFTQALTLPPIGQVQLCAAFHMWSLVAGTFHKLTWWREPTKESEASGAGPLAVSCCPRAIQPPPVSISPDGSGWDAFSISRPSMYIESTLPLRTPSQTTPTECQAPLASLKGASRAAVFSVTTIWSFVNETKNISCGFPGTL